MEMTFEFAVAVAAILGVAALATWGASKLAFTAWRISKMLYDYSKPKLKRKEKVSSSSSTAVLRDINWQPPLMIGNNYDQLYEAKDTTNKNNTNSTKAVVKWEKPKPGWYKLNTDGSVRGGKSGGGGLIRDDRGRWMMGFAKRLEDSDSALAELMALKEGLELAKDLEFTLLQVEVDFKTALNLLGKSDSDLDRRRLGEIVKEIKELMESDDDWEVTINHVARECNKCADTLADIGRGLQKETQHTWPEYHPPKQVFRRVLDEMIDD